MNANKRMRRILSILICLMLLLQYVPVSAFAADGGAAYYAYDMVSGGLTEMNCGSFTTVTSSSTNWSGWMLAEGSVTIEGDVWANYGTNLILADGAELTINGSINAESRAR